VLIVIVASFSVILFVFLSFIFEPSIVAYGPTSTINSIFVQLSKLFALI